MGLQFLWFGGNKPINYVDDCYFCMTNVANLSSKSKGNIKRPSRLPKYPNFPSEIPSVILHFVDLSLLLFTFLPAVVDEPVSSISEESCLKDDCFEPLAVNKSPILITQTFLNDLVRDLKLPKKSAELHGSRLQHNNLLAPNTTYSWYRRTEKDVVQYFSWEETFIYCHSVADLFQAMGCIYGPNKWRLFVDSSRAS